MKWARPSRRACRTVAVLEAMGNYWMMISKMQSRIPLTTTGVFASVSPISDTNGVLSSPFILSQHKMGHIFAPHPLTDSGVEKGVKGVQWTWIWLTRRFRRKASSKIKSSVIPYLVSWSRGSRYFQYIHICPVPRKLEI